MARRKKRKNKKSRKQVIPMNPFLLSIFTNEIRTQCKFALQAEQQITQALASGETFKVFFALQAFLVAVGHVSMLLWPGRPLPGKPTLAKPRGSSARRVVNSESSGSFTLRQARSSGFEVGVIQLLVPSTLFPLYLVQLCISTRLWLK